MTKSAALFNWPSCAVVFCGVLTALKSVPRVSVSALKSHLQLLRELPCRASFSQHSHLLIYIFLNTPKFKLLQPIRWSQNGSSTMLLTRDVVRWHNGFCINNKIDSVKTRPMENLLFSAVVERGYCKHNSECPQMDLV